MQPMQTSTGTFNRNNFYLAFCNRGYQLEKNKISSRFPDFFFFKSTFSFSSRVLLVMGKMSVHTREGPRAYKIRRFKKSKINISLSPRSPKARKHWKSDVLGREIKSPRGIYSSWITWSIYSCPEPGKVRRAEEVTGSLEHQSTHRGSPLFTELCGIWTPGRKSWAG